MENQLAQSKLADAATKAARAEERADAFRRADADKRELDFELPSGIKVHVKKLPPRRGYRMRRDLAVTLGPLFAMLSNDEVVVEEGKPPVRFAKVLSNPDALVSFLRRVTAHLIATQPDNVFLLMARVFRDTVSVEIPSSEPDAAPLEVSFSGTTEEVEDLFDEVFSDDVDMEFCFWEVLVFQFRPTFPVSFISGVLAGGMSGSSKSETSPNP